MFDQYIKKRDKSEVIQISSDEQALKSKYPPPPIFPILSCKQEEVSMVVKQGQKKVKPQPSNPQQPQPVIKPALEVIPNNRDTIVNQVQCSQSSNEYEYQHVINCFQEGANVNTEKVNPLQQRVMISQAEKTGQSSKQATKQPLQEQNKQPIQQQAPNNYLRQVLLKNWMANLLKNKRQSYKL